MSKKLSCNPSVDEIKGFMKDMDVFENVDSLFEVPDATYKEPLQVRKGYTRVDVPKVNSTTIWRDDLYMATDEGLFVMKDGKAVPVEFVMPEAQE